MVPKRRLDVAPLLMHRHPQVITVEIPPRPLRIAPTKPVEQPVIDQPAEGIDQPADGVLFPASYAESLLLVNWMNKYPPSEAEEMRRTTTLIGNDLGHLTCLWLKGQDGWFNDAVIGDVAEILLPYHSNTYCT